MAWLIPDWEKFSSSAALVKLPHSTVFRKVWYFVAFIALTCLFSDVFPIVHPFFHDFNRKYAFYKCKIL